MILIEVARVVRHLICFAALSVVLVADAESEIPIIRPTQTILHSPIPPGTTHFRGARVATDGVTAMVASSSERVVNVYRRDRSGTWSDLAVLAVPGFVPSFTASSNNVAVKGNLAVITESANTSGPQAYVYRYIDGTWQHVQTLSHPAGTPVPSGAFGAVLAIQRDHIVITDEALNDRGAVYIFKRSSDGAFVLSQTIRGASESERLGNDAAIHGETLLVGAANANAAYVFEEVGETWVQRQKLVPARDEIRFGSRVALSEELMAVSSQSRESMRFESPVHLYVPRGPRWKLQQILDGPDGFREFFAFTIAVDGSQLLAQGFSFAAEFEPWSARIFLFERTRGSWRPTAQLIGSEGDPTNRWGEVIAAGRGTVFTTTMLDPTPPVVLGRTYILQLP